MSTENGRIRGFEHYSRYRHQKISKCIQCNECFRQSISRFRFEARHPGLCRSGGGTGGGKGRVVGIPNAGAGIQLRKRRQPFRNRVCRHHPDSVQAREGMRTAEGDGDGRAGPGPEARPRLPRNARDPGPRPRGRKAVKARPARMPRLRRRHPMARRRHPA